MNNRIYSIAKEVKEGCKDIYRAFTEKPVPQMQFPVVIGADNCGGFDYGFIEDFFKPILGEFSFGYTEGVSFDENNICYRFRVGKPIFEAFDETEAINYICQKTESLIHQEIHKRFPNFPSIPNLVAVNLLGNELLISIARNPNGSKIIADYKNQLYRRMKENTFGCNQSENQIFDKRLEEELMEIEQSDENLN